MSKVCSRLCFELRYDGSHMVVMKARPYCLFWSSFKDFFNQNLVAIHYGAEVFEEWMS